MVDVVNRKCVCGKATPTFNYTGNTRATHCTSCKLEGMINVKDKLCRCGKAIPNYNEPGLKERICCLSCKTPTMVNVKDRLCQCGKARPNYNEPGESRAICCVACKTETMVDVKHKRCRCDRVIPTYNEPGETDPICCIRCKTDTMINVVNRRCQCGKAIPGFNEPGETIPICCVSCKTDSMIDVKSRKCPGNPETGCPYQRVGNIKYKNYCTECYRREFPLDPLTFQIRSKTKEIAVRDFINAHYEGFHHDRPIQTHHCDCTIRRRIDHYQLLGNTLLAVETDENQHKSYDAMNEETRYDDLYMAHSGKWVYIRFNPDKYQASNGKTKNPEIATRLAVLKREIDRQIARIQRDENTELVERIYLYYDGYT